MAEFFQVAAANLAGVSEEEWKGAAKAAVTLDESRAERIQQAHVAGDASKLREQLRAADEDRVRMHAELANLRRERETERKDAQVHEVVTRLEREHLKDLRTLIRVLERASD